MHLLTTTSHILRLVTGAVSSICVKVSYMDNSSGTVTPVSYTHLTLPTNREV